MEGLFDNLEGRSDSQNFDSLTSALRFSPCSHTSDFSLINKYILPLLQLSSLISSIIKSPLVIQNLR